MNIDDFFPATDETLRPSTTANEPQIKLNDTKKTIKLLRKKQKLALILKGFDETHGIYKARHDNFINSLVDMPSSSFFKKKMAGSQTKQMTPMLSASKKSWKIGQRPKVMERAKSKV